MLFITCRCVNIFAGRKKGGIYATTLFASNREDNMVGTVDVDKSTVKILISIGDRKCLENHFPISGFKQEGRCLDDSESGFHCTPHRFMARIPQGEPAGSTPFQFGFFVFVPRLSSFGLENALIQMMNRVAAVSLSL